MIRPFTMVAPQDSEANSGLSVATRFTKEEAQLLSMSLVCATSHRRDTAAMLRRLGPARGNGAQWEKAVVAWDKEADALANLHAKVLRLLVEGKGGPS